MHVASFFVCFSLPWASHGHDHQRNAQRNSKLPDDTLASKYISDLSTRRQAKSGSFSEKNLAQILLAPRLANNLHGSLRKANRRALVDYRIQMVNKQDLDKVVRAREDFKHLRTDTDGKDLRIRVTSNPHASEASVATPVQVEESSPFTLALQGMHIALALAASANPAGADEVVAQIWQTFTSLSFTHNCMFEACLAVGAFVVWIAFFESIGYVFPGSERWRLDGKPPVDALKGFTRDWHKTVVPAASYLLSIALFHYFHMGPLLFGTKPEFGDPSFMRVVVEVVSGVFLYDLLFYPFHLSFHKLRLPAWRKMHRRHHRYATESDVVHNAVETVQNSYLDAGIQVFINICVQQISPWGFKHPLSRAIHNLMVTYLLTESHSGYDLPFMSHRLFPGILGGAPRHELHHSRGNVHFHQFFCYLDDAFGFVAQSSPEKTTQTKIQSKAVEEVS